MADISSTRPVSAPSQPARQVAAPSELAVKLLQPLNGLLAAGESAQAEVLSIREQAQQFQLMLRITLDNGKQSTLPATSNKPLEPGSALLVSALSDSRLLANLQRSGSSPALKALNLEQLPIGSLIQGRVDSSQLIAGQKGAQATYQVVVTLLNGAMGGTRLQLETPINLPVGSLVNAQVQGAQQLSFLPLAARLDQLEVKHHLGNQLARQGSLEGLFSSLQNLRNSSGLPAGLQGAIEKLFSSFPEGAQLANPKALALALSNSGEFLESKLLAGASGLQQDLKANLLRLIGQLLPHLPGSSPTATAASQGQLLGQALPGLLREALGQQLRNPSTFPLPTRLAKEMAAEGDLEGLLKLAAAAIARLQTHQLSSLGQTQINAEGNLLTTWQMEIPMRDQQQLVPLQVQIQSEERPSKKKEPGQVVWRVDLAFDLAPLGPLQVQAQLMAGSISSHFWAERAGTASLINLELQHFRQRLLDLGLEVGELDCQQGVPPRGPKTHIEQRWVDEKA